MLRGTSRIPPRFCPAHVSRRPHYPPPRRAAEAISPCHSPRLRSCRTPAVARICRYREIRGPWQNPPAPGFRGVISPRNNLPLFIEKPREFTGIYRILSKFPRPERTDPLLHHTRISRVRVDGQLRANAPLFRPRRKGVEGEFFAMPGERGPTGGLSSISRGDENPATPIAGKCGIGRDR